METDPPSVTTQNDFLSDQPTTADPIMETDLPSVTTPNDALSNETNAGPEIPVVPIAAGIVAGCTAVLSGGTFIVIVICWWCPKRRKRLILGVNVDGDNIVMMNSMKGERILYSYH